MSKGLFSEFLVKDGEAAWSNAGKPPVNPAEAARKKVVAYVDTALGHVTANDDNPQRGAYKTKGDLAQVTIKAGRDIIPIGGQERSIVPREKLKAFLEAVKEAAESGKLDDILVANAGASTTTRSTGTRSAAWTPERRAAHAERLKQVWADKAKGAKPKK